MLKRDKPQWYGVQPKLDEKSKQIGFYPTLVGYRERRAIFVRD